MIRLFKVYMHPSAMPRVNEVLESGYIGQGPKVEEFELQLNRRFGDGVEVLTINSCTSALDLALHMCDVGPGDHVVTTPQTCTATNGVIVQRHAHPIWADIDPLTGNLDPDSVKAKLTPQTKAIMAVDWGGRACDYEALKSFGVPVIEDAAHAVLTTRNGQHIAQVGGDYVCFSFQAIKHLTTGDGGAIVTPPSQTERARLLRWYGLDRRSSASFRCEQNITEVGYKYHMNDVAAAIGLANMEAIDIVVLGHRSNAKMLHDALSGTPGIKVQSYDPESSYWIFSILVDDPRGFIARMAERGVEASPVHARNDKHDAFRSAAVNTSDLPGVSVFESGHVAIPVGWWLTKDDLHAVVQATLESVQ